MSPAVLLRCKHNRVSLSGCTQSSFLCQEPRSFLRGTNRDGGTKHLSLATATAYALQCNGAQIMPVFFPGLIRIPLVLPVNIDRVSIIAVNLEVQVNQPLLVSLVDECRPDRRSETVFPSFGPGYFDAFPFRIIRCWIFTRTLRTQPSWW